MESLEDIKGKDLFFIFDCIECGRDTTVGHLDWVSIFCEFCGVENTEKMIVKYGKLRGLSRSLLVKKNNPTVISEFSKQLNKL
mgnify:FL=1|tara:strand:+ start:525 stop:773 length:249 start_codon:yes stop_codon:yes gene_type:complete